NLARQRKWEDGLAVLRECLPICEAKLPDEWPAFHVKSMLGGMYLGQKKYAEAEPLLLASYEGMWERRSRIPAQLRDARLQEAMGRLAELFEATREKTEKRQRGELTADKSAVAHEVELSAGKAVVIVMQSKAFDTYLRLIDEDRKILVENDDIDFEAK